MHQCRRSAAILGAGVLLLGTAAVAADPAPKRPNFVFFLTDDQRADALSIEGHALLKTPNIDRIAKEGVRFKNAFVVNALCTPSRACYLTGKYSHATGVLDNGRNARLSKSTVILPELLREAGYEVAFIGKSHMQGNLRDRTWDYYFGFRGQGQYVNPVVSENGAPDRHYEGYMDDVLTDKALDYLNRPREKPFCLFLWFKAPHRSWVRAPRFAKLYEGMKVPDPPTYRTGYVGKSRAVIEADMKIGDFPDVPSLDQIVKDYSATIAAVDENVGRVLGTLDRKKLAEDTVVIYGSDNGFFLGEWNFFDKRLMYEPSIRIPLLVRYPRRFKAGTIRNEQVLNVDVAPTILEIAGVSVPKDMQGKSFLKPALGEAGPWRDAWLYEYYEYPDAHRVRPHRGIRTDRWKLIHFYGESQEWELYDLEKDPHETTNVYGRPDFAETVNSLKARMVSLRKELGDPDLGKN